ncbi:hypothetical protein [Fuerstiella marisgermanici]|uniref:Uncharacterized protein n=1 Tax=Fuerstiella marisgermanici TaxID=1891926 RepID=A0A1P8W9E1_9PLAN|nr:hypothetical protein [Fuerstiella marisgermanici]APZ90683.1 hypothetical protein Fuma_00264 [Fuerstiella marisgermanici]
MLEMQTQHQQQLWVLQRLHRICEATREAASTEPCLEQYEQQVRLMMDEAVSDAAAEWIRIIVQSLRTGRRFRPQEYMRAA